MDQQGRISRVLEEKALEQGEKLFWVSEDGEVTYAEFFSKVEQLACSLLSAGIRKGDRVGIWLSNRMEFTLVEMAANLIGAVGVPISTRYKSHELGYILKHSGVRILFMLDTLANIDFFNLLSDVIPDASNALSTDLQTEALPALDHVVCLNLSGGETPGYVQDFNRFSATADVSEWKEGLEAAKGRCYPKELSYIQYTSGSTGLPKGVMYSHELVLTSLTVQGERSRLSPDDRMLIVAPFFHGLGHMAGPPLGIVFGASIVPLEIFDAQKALQYIEQYRCTTLFAVPTMFQLMLEHPDFEKRSLDSLRVGLITAAPSPLGLKREITEKIPSMALLTGYGSTETGGGCTHSKIGDPPEVVEDTIGFPLRTYEVKIFDPSTGHELPPRTPGELCTRGPCIMMGYYGEEKNAEVIDKDGWFHTGDLAEYDEEGYLKIVGRIKDMIITGGNNVYPAEVTAILEEHPAVKEAQVIGVPDPLKSEVIMAYVILKEGMTCTPKEVQDFCKQRTSNYKVPQYVQFIDGFPVSGSGKVMKDELKKMAMETLES